jgi:ribonuclease G
MSKEIIINNTKDRARIAIVENKQLTELYAENAENTRTIGDIFLGRVRNLMPSIQAAFVDIGQKQDAFLHFSDIDENFPRLLEFVGEKLQKGSFPIQLKARRRGPTVGDEEIEIEREDGEEAAEESESKSGAASEKKRTDDADHPARYLRNGQKVLVQITKEPIASKGSRVSSNISIAGRFLVLVPKADYVAVSRKIWSVRERRRLRALARSLTPEGFGVIVRTVAEGRDAKTLDTDLSLLLDKWSKIEEKAKESDEVPRLLHKDVSMVSSVVRDLFTEDYDRILIDDVRLHRSIRSYVKAVAPHMADIVKFYEEPTPIFESVNIADAVAEAFDQRVKLPSGGYVIIEHTEAMHVIDVNSGSAGKGQSQEENATRVNLEAARVIARQLRLRDLGGIIVIDFIDMRDAASRRKVYEAMRQAFRSDRAVTKVLTISDFGLMQITRQRLRPSITRDETTTKDVLEARAERERKIIEEARGASEELKRLRAQVNGGRGARTTAEFVESLESWLKHFKEAKQGRSVLLRLHPFAAAFLTRGIPSMLTRLRLRFGLRLSVQTDEEMSPLAFRCLDPRTGDEVAPGKPKPAVSAGGRRRGGIKPAAQPAG